MQLRAYQNIGQITVNYDARRTRARLVEQDSAVLSQLERNLQLYHADMTHDFVLQKARVENEV